ncbi:MAG: hypothetical protein QOF40_2875 [Actinomycetota bacterium]|nr:hypothetical protein [Actinomycetota bacterium]
MWHTVTVEGDPEVVAILVALLPQAEHPMPATRSMHYTVERSDGRFAVREEGDELTVAPDAAGAADAIHVRAHRRAFELASLAGWSRVHAATVDLPAGRVLVVGPSGAGKTTLAARLLLDGADVQGDESVLVRRGASLAVPRALHLKPGFERVLPELALRAGALPSVGDITVLDPSRLGRPWRLHEAPIRHVVLLDGPGAVRCTLADRAAVLEALLADAFPLTETKAGIVATLAGAIAGAQGHRLSVGEPGAMVDALRRAVK